MNANETLYFDPKSNILCIWNENNQYIEESPSESGAFMNFEIRNDLGFYMRLQSLYLEPSRLGLERSGLVYVGEL